MTILIVDDDAHVVQSVRGRIDWERLGIDRVLTAANVRQAKNTISAYPVDLLLCDIEMPQGSGLDLLEWIREQGMDLPAIFLTSYANFDYARRAIALESLEYYLKPINYPVLEEGLARAVEKAGELRDAKRHQQQSTYWENNRVNLLEHFWYQLISGKLGGDPLAVARQIEHDLLPYTMQSLFIPVVFSAVDRGGNIISWGENTFDYGVRNVMEEVFRECDFPPAAIQKIENESWVVILQAQSRNQFLDIEMATTRMIEVFNTIFDVDVFCGIGYMNVLHELHGNITGVATMLANNVHQVNQSLQLSKYEHQHLDYPPPPIREWEQDLEQNRFVALHEKVHGYLAAMTEGEMVNAETLKRFRLDFTQLIYSFLRGREIQANELFYNEESERLYSLSVMTIEDMHIYWNHLLDSAASFMQYVQSPGGVVQKLVEYIDENFTQEISRKEIAKMVFLNPDYISRLFKKEMGKSIGAYIMEKRIQKAKELLVETDMPIYEISIFVGYDNFAYFSKLFRRSTGHSPNEYRKARARQSPCP